MKKTGLLLIGLLCLLAFTRAKSTWEPIGYMALLHQAFTTVHFPILMYEDEGSNDNSPAIEIFLTGIHNVCTPVHVDSSTQNLDSTTHYFLT